MKAMNESNLQNCLKDSGQRTRLRDYRKRLACDSSKRVFDDRSLAVLLAYARDPGKIKSEVRYLENLSNADGELFSRSLGHYSDIKAQFDNFAKPEKSSFRWNRHMQKGVAIVGARYAKAKLRMRKYHSVDDIYESVTDWSTATGFESIRSGRRKKVELLSDAFEVLIEKETEAKENGSFGEPIICGSRTQGSGAYDDHGRRTHTWKPKKRAVFIVGPYQIMSESRFGAPLNDWLRNYPYTAIGKDDHWLLDWVAKQKRAGRNFISLDYSKYDSTIPSWLIHAAFEVLAGAFDEYDCELLKVIEEDFINKNIITPDDVLHVTHGNPSGSRLTAVINGICNEIITETWLDAFQLKAVYNIMGDDNLIYFTEVADVSIALIGQYIEHNFGIKVNLDKCNSGNCRQDPEYLSRYWSDAGAWRWEGDVISLICYPEKFRPYDRLKKQGIVLTPELIIYSYILAYPVTMRKLMDVDQFMRDGHIRLSTISWTKEQREAVPYNVRSFVELNNLVRRPNRSSVLEGLARKSA
jgi:hypothetical protein